MSDTFIGEHAFDRICNLIINHTGYNYKGRYKLLGFMLKNEKNFK